MVYRTPSDAAFTRTGPGLKAGKAHASRPQNALTVHADFPSLTHPADDLVRVGAPAWPACPLTLACASPRAASPVQPPSRAKRDVFVPHIRDHIGSGKGGAFSTFPYMPTTGESERRASTGAPPWQPSRKHGSTFQKEHLALRHGVGSTDQLFHLKRYGSAPAKRPQYRDSHASVKVGCMIAEAHTRHHTRRAALHTHAHTHGSVAECRLWLGDPQGTFSKHAEHMEDPYTGEHVKYTAAGVHVGNKRRPFITYQNKTRTAAHGKSMPALRGGEPETADDAE